MAKRLGGVLLGFGVNIAGEFCICYNVRLGDMCARSLPTLTNVCTKEKYMADCRRGISKTKQLVLAACGVNGSQYCNKRSWSAYSLSLSTL
jgi:hypothetical protein